MGSVDGVAILPGTVQTVALGGDITPAGKALLDDANTAAQRTTLGLGTLATQNGTFSGTSSGTNTGDVTLAGTPDYLTISGQVITRGPVDLATDVTGDLPLSNVTSASGASLLLGRGAGAGAGDFQEIALGTNLSMSGTTLNVSGLADGDKGDITVSSSGTVWTIDAGAVDTAKLGGDVTTAGKALLDDADAAAQRTTLGLGTLATQSGTFSGTSSGTNSGDVTLAGTPDYITIAGQVITRGLIDLTTDVTGDLPLANVAPASAASVLLGRGSSAGAGDFQEITLGSNLSMSGTVLSATGGGGVSDGDKGDITVSSSGTVWTIDSGVVDTTKLGGDVTTAGKALLDDVDAAAQRTTLGLGTLATQSGTFSGTSSGTNTGDVILSGTPDYITIAGQTITRGLIDLATDVTGDLPFSNLAQVASDTLLGRSAAGTGDVTTITCTAAGRNLLDDPDTTVQRATLGLGTLATQSSVDLATQVTGDLPFSNITQIAADTLLGRSTASTGDIETITCTSAGRALLDDVDAPAQRTTLGLGTLATQSGTFSGSSSGTNTGDVTLAGTPDYITISGQTITRGLIDLATDVTGALPYANGGTGNTSVPTANSGDYVLVYDSSTGVAKVINVSGAGTTQFLRYNGGDVLFDTPPTFTSGAAGYAPASGGGTTNFLRADGTWTTPTVGSVSANNVTAGTFPGATYTFADSLTVTSDLTVDTNLIKTDSTNNRVGINQTTPLYALDVTGTARVTGTTTFNGLTYTWPASQTANYYLQTNGSGTLSWAAAGGGSSPDGYTYIVKPSIGGLPYEQFTNAGLTNDSNFFFTVSPNNYYMVRMELAIAGNNTTGDFTMDFNVSTGTMKGRGNVQNLTAAEAIQNVIITAAGTASTTAIVTGTPADLDTPIAIRIQFAFFYTSGASGTFRFRFGNAAAAAGRTSRVYAGSVMAYKTLI